MPIKMELEIEKSADAERPFEASIDFIADGKPRCAFTLGRSTIMEAAMDALKMVTSMAPNAMQEELDRCYKEWDKLPSL